MPCTSYSTFDTPRINITLSFKDRWQKEKTRRAARKAARQRNTQAIGLGWYSREQWEALTKVVPDRSELDDTYEAWEAQATDALQTLAAQGARPVKGFLAQTAENMQ